MNDATELLRRYARERDEEAFRQVVAQYFDFVHGVAARRLGPGSAHALDVVQVVFTNLARNAGALRNDSQIGGWLHSNTCFVAAKYLRSETRRVAREQQAVQMNSLNDSEDLWPAVAPVIDEALQDLSEPDRAAILLRYFEGRDLKGVGEVFSVSEDAAQKRVQRAIDRLKSALEGRGVAVAVTTLAALLLANASPAQAAAPIAPISAKAATAGVRRAAPSLLEMAAAIVGASIVIWLIFGLSGTATEKNRRAHEASTAIQNPAVPVPPAQVAIKTKLDGPALMLHVVSKATGLPIRGATVVTTTADPRNSIAAQERAEITFATDATGVARIPLSDPPPELLRMQTYAEGHGGWVCVWEKYKGEEIPKEFTVTLEPGIPIGGRVVDESGNAVAGVEVGFGQSARNGIVINRDHQRASMAIVTNVTDAAGVWAASHVSEPFIDILAIHFRHPDFQPAFPRLNDHDVAELRERNWTVILKKGQEITGTVTNEKGEPVAGAKVQFGGDTNAERKQTTTGPDGRYQLKGLPTRPLPMGTSVYAAGYAPASKPLKPSDAVLDFVLTPGTTIRARVVNAAGEPMKRIRVSREFDRAKDGMSFHFETDDDGRFVWNESPNEPQSFYFLAPGYQQLRNKLLSPGAEEQVVTLQKDIRLSGTVKDAVTGKPVPEFTISQGQDRIYTLSMHDVKFKDGVFDVALGEANYNLLSVRAAGYMTTSVPMTSDYKFDVRLQPAETLEGVVVDSSGLPIAGAEVVVMQKEQSQNPLLRHGRFAPSPVGDRAMSDGMGRFSIRPGSEVSWIVAAHPEAGIAERPASEFKKRPELRLAPWAKIVGNAISNNIAMAGVELRLSTFSSARLDYQEYQRTTDSSGHFEFELVPAGSSLMISSASSARSFRGTNFSVMPGSVREIQVDVGGLAPVAIDRPATK